MGRARRTHATGRRTAPSDLRHLHGLYRSSCWSTVERSHAPGMPAPCTMVRLPARCQHLALNLLRIVAPEHDHSKARSPRTSDDSGEYRRWAFLLARLPAGGTSGIHCGSLRDHPTPSVPGRMVNLRTGAGTDPDDPAQWR